MNRDPQGPRRSRWTVIGVAALLLMLAAALGYARKDAGRATPPQRGGVLTIGLASEPDSLNVYFARTVESLFVANRILPRLAREVLPDGDRPGGFQPEFATSWDDKDGGRVMVFHLRKGRWSDGTAMTCADLQFTLRVQTDPEIAWRGASSKAHIVKIECPDPRTAVVTFDKVSPTRLMDVNDQHLVPRSLASVPFPEWRRVDWATRLPAGNAFRLGKVTPGQEFVLERNPGYWGAPELPRLDKLVVRVVPDASSRVNQLLTGDLDFADNLSPADARRVSGDANVRVVRRSGWSYTYLGWMTIDRDAYAAYVKEHAAECQRQALKECPDDAATVARLAREKPHPLFGDPRVRRAMTLAINRQELIDTLFQGEAEIPSSPILAPLPEHDAQLQPWPYDLAAAKKLLQEAGFGDADKDGVLDRKGKPFKFELVVQAGNSLRRNAAVLIQSDLAKLGVAMQIVPVENTSYFATVAARKCDAWIASWLVSLRVEMNQVLHADACGSGDLDFGAFNDPQVDALATQARDTVDDGARAKLWRRWEASIHELQPYTFLFRPRRLVGVRNRVQGVESLLANDSLNGVETWSLAQGPQKR